MKKQIINGSELANKKLEVKEGDSLRIVVNGRFIPNHGDVVWFVNSYGDVINRNYNQGDKGCLWFIRHKKVFRTKEECEEYKKYLELLDRYTFEPEWYNYNQEKWHIFWDYYNNKIEYSYCISAQHTDKYFETEESAMEFVEEVGESNIKKFMFNIWE